MPPRKPTRQGEPAHLMLVQRSEVVYVHPGHMTDRGAPSAVSRTRAVRRTAGQSRAVTDDLGYFGPASVTWRVLTDPAAGVGGVRALFLQALHHRAIAGVNEHGDFGDDFCRGFSARHST